MGYPPNCEHLGEYSQLDRGEYLLEPLLDVVEETGRY
jgi:hypothetical protein